jgi:hypothetical protein
MNTNNQLTSEKVPTLVPCPQNPLPPIHFAQELRTEDSELDYTSATLLHCYIVQQFNRSTVQQPPLYLRYRTAPTTHLLPAYAAMGLLNHSCYMSDRYNSYSALSLYYLLLSLSLVPAPAPAPAPANPSDPSSSVNSSPITV